MNPIINQIFYTLKPLVPRSSQIALRRIIAKQKRRKCAHIWPIDPNSATPPQDWPGWPGGKKFALVLSHDVDTHKGYNNVLKLADLEEQMASAPSSTSFPKGTGKSGLACLTSSSAAVSGSASTALTTMASCSAPRRYLNKAPIESTLISSNGAPGRSRPRP